MHVFTENLVGFHFTSYDAYCNKPLLPLLYKKGNRHLKLHSKMMLFRGHTFFSYYTCSLSLWVKIPPGHLYCLWLSFQKEISRGCKNALSGSWVLVIRVIADISEQQQNLLETLWPDVLVLLQKCEMPRDVTGGVQSDSSQVRKSGEGLGSLPAKEGMGTRGPVSMLWPRR